MARARNIKPGFFKNEDLAALPPLCRILFQGLWCLADREGRLENRPLRIKAEVIPYDSASVSTFLKKLEKAGFILCYESEGKAYIQILKFKKHQYPHITEVKSTIPAPCEHDVATVLLPKDNGSKTPESPIPNSEFLRENGIQASSISELPGADPAKPSVAVATSAELEKQKAGTEALPKQEAISVSKSRNGKGKTRKDSGPRIQDSGAKRTGGAGPEVRSVGRSDAELRETQERLRLAKCGDDPPGKSRNGMARLGVDELFGVPPDPVAREDS